MTDIANRIANLPPEKQELLRRRLEAARTPASDPITRRERAGSIFPMSFAQQRLWLLDQLDPDTPVYNIPEAVRLRGPLDVTALEQSVTQIIRRHETLRTTFDVAQGQPVQRVHPPAPFQLPLTDLRPLPAAERRVAAQQHLATFANRPFDLQRGPLLWAALLQLSQAEHIFLLNLHHIVADGWSMSVFMRELSALYRAYAGGQPPSLPALPLQYADVTLWQQERLAGSRLDDQLSYWQRQLANPPPALELPIDRPRPPRQTFNGAQESLTLSPTLSAGLSRLSQQADITLFMLLLAAFKGLLFRYTGQPDIIVGTPVANRPRQELEGLIGFFLNTLALRSHINSQMTFRELLAQVRQTTLQAYAHQEVPFETLLAALQPRRDLSHNALYQVMFILQNTPQPALDLPGLTVEPLTITTRTAKLALTLQVTSTANTLTVTAEYNRDLFDAGTVNRLLSHYQTLLAAIVANPDEKVAALPLLTAQERRQILIDWNDTARAYPLDEPVQQLFARQAAQTPNAPAFFEGPRVLSYRELDEQSNRLARHLQRQGAGPGVLVGISLERSLEMVIGLLGILKSGAAYVPLDPDYPAQRLTAILHDTRLSVVVTRQGWAARWQAHHLTLICLDDKGARWRQEPAQPVKVAVTGDSPAYVLYTSGSTGQPKGVVGLHQGIVNRLHWMHDTHPLADDEVGCQKTSLNFIDSIWEIFGPLVRGVPTVILPNAVVQDPEQLVSVLAARGVSRLWLVPPALRAILDSVPDLPGRLPRLRMWITTGEAITPELYHRFEKLAPHAALYNLYGTSEVWDATWYPPAPGGPAPARVPIGRPIANVSAYVLDANLQPVPIGVAGELYIGGAGVALGYLNQPALTADRFIANPIAASPHPRLYKTGDLARYLPDGNLEYLGRLDHQVKIRGYRVELGEIEAALARHPAVIETAVIARDTAAGERHLVAYVVSPQASLAPASLRHFLQQTLLPPMIPDIFAIVPALPLTPSGKIDRTALPDPHRFQPAAPADPQPPTTPIQRTLADIWSDLLGVAQISLHDNFFALGGHSLLAARAMAATRAEFDLNLPLRCLFEAPTIAALANLIEAVRNQNGTTAARQAAQVKRWIF